MAFIRFTGLFLLLGTLVNCGDDQSSGNLRILERYPAPNAFDIPVDTVIKVQFNQPLKEVTINEFSFLLLRGENQVSASVSYIDSSLTAILRPANPMQFSTLYSIGLSDAIEDQAGNRLENLAWSFITETAGETVEDTLTARYKATFNATWSKETHPADFPVNPHFSGLIGITHRDSLNMYVIGQPATPGIKNMAETGSKTELISEFEELIASGAGQIIISADGISSSPGSVTFEFEVKSSHSLVTIFSMIAPSPDWYIVVESISLNAGGFWIPSKTSNVSTYDAGTDSGTTFASPNLVSDPPEGIRLITTPPLATNGSVRSMGRITFERIN